MDDYSILISSEGCVLEAAFEVSLVPRNGIVNQSDLEHFAIDSQSFKWCERISSILSIRSIPVSGWLHGYSISNPNLNAIRFLDFQNPFEISNDLISARKLPTAAQSCSELPRACQSCPELPRTTQDQNTVQNHITTR